MCSHALHGWLYIVRTQGQAGSGQIVHLQGPMSYAVLSEKPLCPVGDSARVTYTEDTGSHLHKISWTLCYISKPCHSVSIQSNLVTSIRATRCVRFGQTKAREGLDHG